MKCVRSKAERRRNFIANQVDECKDLSGLYYLLPIQKGYLVNWDTQRQIWDYAFGSSVLNVTTSDLSLILSEPIFNFPSIQENMDEVFFEEYNFQSLTRLPTPTYSALNHLHSHPDALCTVVVDTGYSFTHVVPYYRGRIVPRAILRIDVGGKLLTNYLKEVVSYRQLHVLDETYVMNQVKEDACYVSLDFNKDMELAREKRDQNTVVCEYVLPNFSDRRRGYIKESVGKTSNVDEQSLVLANERIAIPEILFHPSDIGVQQMGIPEAIAHSISLTPKEMHPHLYSNILLTGGSAMFDGFQTRVQQEVRRLCSDDYHVKVFASNNPVTFAWEGGYITADEGNRPKFVEPVTAAEYKEFGHSICQKKFSECLQWSADYDSQ